jgi:hypothetical protein
LKGKAVGFHRFYHETSIGFPVVPETSPSKKKQASKKKDIIPSPSPCINDEKNILCMWISLSLHRCQVTLAQLHVGDFWILLG